MHTPNVLSACSTASEDLGVAVQQKLSHWNHQRLDPTAPSQTWEAELTADAEMRLIEGRFVEGQREAVAARSLEAATDVAGFIDWFEGLKAIGPGQNDPLFP